MGKEPRLVIPFFDKDNQLIGAQGRALQESKIRYVTVKVHEDAPKVFGLERWNSDQHTYLVEGPIDSLFLPNCLAMAGADMSDLSILNKDKIWPNSITCKDINDMVLTSIKDARLVEIINRNTYSGQRGEWEVHSWKKV